jgi:type II restriction/modification system DNA methylase subunit YeeA
LYQFYISEKKDQVIGKVVKSEDIPAATQLFTPNWIVQYLVQNSVGRQWMQTYPDSTLVQQMPYYIAPAEQSAEVQAQLAAITPSEIAPESIKVLDPAVGSGHILVEAYKVLKAIYAERGYRTRDIPQLILQHNLFGLDIDDRAGQLAGFALMMLAREDDRRIFERDIRLNVLALQESSHVDLPTLWRDLGLGKAWQSESLALFAEDQPSLGDDDARLLLLRDVVGLFAQAKTFGSLIDVPAAWLADLLALQAELEGFLAESDLIRKRAAGQLLPLLRQAVLLAQRYDAVVANPPYMGGKGMNAELKGFAQKNYPDSKSDLFSIFISRLLKVTKSSGNFGFMTPFTWMFLSSYEKLRKDILENYTLTSLIRPEYHAFFESAFVPICAFCIESKYINDYTGSFIDLQKFYGADLQPEKTLEAIENHGCGWFFEAKPDDFKKIPASPIAYWVSERLISIFENYKLLGDFAEPKAGLATGDNERFQRNWSEVSKENIYLNCTNCDDSKNSLAKWYPCHSGGQFRRWYGNHDIVVNWQNDGDEIRSFKHVDGRQKSRPQNTQFFFKQGLTWTKLSSTFFAVRFRPSGFVFDDTGRSAFFADTSNELPVLAAINSNVGQYFLKVLNPTMSFTSSDVANIPINLNNDSLDQFVKDLIVLSKSDWDAYERSWDFARLPILSTPHKQTSLAASYTATRAHWQHMTLEMQRLEQENNRIFIDAYGLQDELTPDVPLKEITLTCNPHYRYGGDNTPEQLEQRLQSDTAAELISYAIGCMMGRYSLDRDGLVYAHAGNQGFNDLVQAGAYNSFPADDDGIIPLTEQEWFEDDTTTRFANFIQTVWPESPLNDNLNFVADSLCLNAIKPPSKKGMAETAHDTIRRYLSSQFYKDHLKTYKKRPIYWLFSSGKEKAFECLVYLHRYNESTLARMRTEYVIPLTAKLAAYVQKLEQDKDASESTTEARRLEKDISDLHKKQAELSTFDEKLRHYADMRIALDLDDGVKVNYGKFGDLLANVKDVTGGNGD